MLNVKTATSRTGLVWCTESLFLRNTTNIFILALSSSLLATPVLLPCGAFRHISLCIFTVVSYFNPGVNHFLPFRADRLFPRSPLSLRPSSLNTTPSSSPLFLSLLSFYSPRLLPILSIPPYAHSSSHLDSIHQKKFGPRSPCYPFHLESHLNFISNSFCRTNELSISSISTVSVLKSRVRVDNLRARGLHSSRFLDYSLGFSLYA